MFRKELEAKLSKIFGLHKTTFNTPSESYEQETLFVLINESRCRITKGRAYGEVKGSIVVFAQEEKLPYGFFHKRIQQAALELTRDLFFEKEVNIESSPGKSGKAQNITERRVSFTYLYSAQHDPKTGELTSVIFPSAQAQERHLDVGDGTVLDIGDGTILEP